jgi:aliphatic nitrilase
MGDVYPKFTAAAIQASPVYLNREKTTEKTIELLKEAAKEGAKLIVFPEAFIAGYPYFAWLGTPMWYHNLFKEWYKNAVEIPSRTTKQLCEAAKEANAYLVVGVNERDGNTIYNTLLFISKEGHILGKHRKLMPTHVERTVWGMGDGSDLVVFDTDMGKLSGLICWEHTMDLVRHALYAMGEQIHCAVWVGFSNVKGWETLFNMSTELCARYHAHVGECFVINVQNTTDEALIEKLCETDYQSEWIKPGGGWTAIIGPGGGILSGPLTDKEGILYAEIDMEAIIDMAHWHDAVGHYSRPDVVSLLVNKEKYSEVKEVRREYATLRPFKVESLVKKFESLKELVEKTENEKLKRMIDEFERELTKFV